MNNYLNNCFIYIKTYMVYSLFWSNYNILSGIVSILKQLAVAELMVKRNIKVIYYIFEKHN